MPWPFPDPRIVAPAAATPKLPLGIGRPPMPVAGPQHLAARDGGFLGRLMPTPRGMGGLLTDEDLRHARAQGLLGFGLGLLDYNTPSTEPKSFGQGLARAYGAGQQAFQGSAQGAAQGAIFEQEQAKQAKMDALRQEVGTLMQNPRLSNEQRQQAVLRMLGAAYQTGDTEIIGALSQVLQALKQEGPDGSIKEVVGPGGKPMFGYVTPQGVSPIPGPGPMGAAERAPRLVSGTNAQGQPTYLEYDPNTGQFRDTGMTPAGSRDSAGTEGERKAAVLLEIAGPSSEALDAFDAPNRLAQIVGAKGLQELSPDQQQLLDLHSMAVADAYIRLTSGANAPEPEVERAFRMIAPRAGDSMQTLAAKRALRKRFLRALELGAGRAASRVTPLSGAAPPPSPTGAGSQSIRQFLPPKR